MELRHLRYFVAVAEEEHFGRAAARLHIAQPPLSRQVRQLEEEVGASLIERHGRGIRLTEAGRVFLEGARQTLESALRAGARARAASRGEIGRLTVGYVDTSTYNSLPPRIFRRFRARFPGITLDLMPMTSMNQWQALRDDQIQVGFVYHLPSDDAAVASRPIYQDHVVVALPRGHRLARRRHLALADLRGESFVWFPRAISPRYYDAVTAACQARGLHINVVQEASHDATIVSLVAGGMGLTFAVGAWRHVKPASIVLRRLPDLHIPLRVSAIWRTDRDRPSVQSFLGVVADMCPTR
jgi:DNA-binding transcriptional LysR family regulator